MKLKTALDRLVNFAASLVAMAVSSVPLIWLLRLPDDEFRQLFQGIELREFRVLEVIAVVVWLIVFVLLNRLFERLLDRLLHRPRKPWLKN